MKLKFKKEPAIIVLGLGAMAGVIAWAHQMKIKELDAVAPILQQVKDMDKELKEAKEEIKALKEKSKEEEKKLVKEQKQVEPVFSPSQAKEKGETKANDYCPVWSWEPYYSYNCWLYYNYYNQ